MWNEVTRNSGAVSEHAWLVAGFHGGQDSNPRQVVWDVWWRMWNWGKFVRVPVGSRVFASLCLRDRLGIQLVPMVLSPGFKRQDNSPATSPS
jgi:hypothetical protein